MSGERLLRILAQLSPGGAEPSAARLCQVSAEVTSMTGAGIMLMTGDMPRGSVCTTDDVSDRIEELQYALGEGPCVDAYVKDRPVVEPDLAQPRVPRWPAFTGPALDAGVRAIAGFPLRVGAVRLGALNLYGDRPAPFTADQHVEALLMASVAARAVLAMQAQAPPGQLASALEEGADLRYGVHQAAGMVAAQLGVSVGQALVRLRAYAFGNECSLTDVAEDVVARRLRFENGSDQEDSQS